MKLFKKFRAYLLENTQINAVYYGRVYFPVLKPVIIENLPLKASFEKENSAT